MTYDYSRNFLERHRSWVPILEKLVRENEVLVLEMETADDVRNKKRQINNVIACLVKYEPDLGVPLRKAIRTWTDFKEDKWIIFVGIPQHRITGRPPKTTANIQEKWSSAYKAPTAETYYHPKPWDGDMGKIFEFGGPLIALPPQTTLAYLNLAFEVPPEGWPSIEQYFNEWTKPEGWTAHMEKPSQVRFERTPA